MKTISTKIVKGLFTAAFALVATTTFAQEEELETKKAVSIGGTVDAYYRTQLSAPDTSPQATGSFGNQTGFALGMANIIASYEGAKTGAVADLVFGPRGNEAILNNAAVNVNQLYAYWNVCESVTLTAGRFNTFLGYEVISPAANFNYSTSYLFNAGPFSHVGLKADFALSEDFSLMLAVMNVNDIDNNATGNATVVPGAYSLGAQLGYAGQFLNFIYDGEANLGFEVDYTGGFDVSEDFFLGINAAYANNDGVGFYGAALYPQFATSDDLTIGLRGEFFGTYDDIDATDDATIFGLTLTGSYTIENLMIKPELRLDSASNDIFTDNDGALLSTKSLSTFAIAAIYSF